MGKNDDKTEKATPQRRQKARAEGQVARSQEVAVVVSLAGGALALRALTGPGMAALRRETTVLLGTGAPDITALGDVGRRALVAAVALGGPFLAVAVAGAVVAGVAQTGLSVAPKAAAPKLSHLSPARGLQRLKPSEALWELARTAVKLGLLVAVVWPPLRVMLDAPPTARSLDAGVTIVGDQVWTLLVRGLLVAALVAVGDYAYNRRKTSRKLRMSKQEVKQEFRNSEGDPLIKGMRRRRHHELSRNRMLFETARADVIVTNPTHLAVALRFAPGEAAPRVVAKGADHLAARIRATAHRHGVPVRQDVALARALHRSCKVGAYVPAGLYEAVAVVLAYAYRLTGRAAA